MGGGKLGSFRDFTGRREKAFGHACDGQIAIQDGVSTAETGLDQPESKVTIQLKDNAGKFKMTRFVRPDMGKPIEP